MGARVNHVAVLVSAIAFFLIGALWYAALFGHQWMAITGTTGKPASEMTSTYAITFVLAWILSYAIAMTLADSARPGTLRRGVELGIMMGIGVFATMSLMDCLYEGRPLALWLIDTGYVVVGMAVAGAIVGAWQNKTAAAAA